MLAVMPTLWWVGIWFRILEYLQHLCTAPENHKGLRYQLLFHSKVYVDDVLWSSVYSFQFLWKVCDSGQESESKQKRFHSCGYFRILTWIKLQTIHTFIFKLMCFNKNQAWILLCFLSTQKAKVIVTALCWTTGSQATKVSKDLLLIEPVRNRHWVPNI